MPFSDRHAGLGVLPVATMKDVADRAGVAPITVSRVVNNSGYVGRATRLKVLRAIEELQYVPNVLASNLRSRKSDTVALVLPDITNSFWTSMARGAEDESWQHGWGVFICNTDNDPDKEEGYIQRLIQRRVDGVIIMPTRSKSSERQISRLMEQGVRCVVINRPLEDERANVVRSDGKRAAFTLATELINAGCTRIAFVGLPDTYPTSRDRLQGYRDALRAAGLPFSETRVRQGQNDGESGGREMVEDLLSQGLELDGLLLANSRLALGGLKAIEGKGLNIPRDLMVAAFHDITTMDSYAPWLITAVQPAYQMGQLAARRLIEMRSAVEGPVKEIVLEPTIHFGQFHRRHP